MPLSFKRFIFIVFLFVFICVCFLPLQSSHAAFFPSKLKYYTLKTEHFYIHFPKGLGPVADEFKTISEDAYKNITGRLGWAPWGRTHVVLSDKTDRANGMATVIPYNYILLYITPPSANSSLDTYKDYFKLLFNHEFTHIVHIDMHYRWASPARWVFGRIVSPNGATPGWMREGMAVYEESQLDAKFGRNNYDYTNMILRSAYYENKFPRIDQITGVSKTFPAALGPYLFGGKFFQWLANTYGEDRMYKYQKEYASGLWLFSLNNKARRVYSKSFYKLYKEFKTYCAQMFEEQRQQLTALGLTPMEDIIKTKDSQEAFILRPNSNGFAYFESSLDNRDAIIIHKDENAEPEKIKRPLNGQMSFSKTGRYLAFGSLASVEPSTSLAEIYYYDLDKKTLHRVADAEHARKSMRVQDPDFSPEDGGQRWLVMVRNFFNTDQLYIFDLYEKHGYVITTAEDKTQFSNPRFSPDGSKIAVTQTDPNTGFRDIVVYSKTGKLLYKITNDISPDSHPVFSPDGRYIYFDSYRSGIANIYRYSILNKTTTKLTNVLDGVFEPIPARDGLSLFVKRYNTTRKYIQKFHVNPYAKNTYQTISEKEEKTAVKKALVSGRNYSIIPQKDNTVIVAEHTLKPSAYSMPSPSALSHNNGPEDSKLFQRPINYFSYNPETVEYLPAFLYGNHMDKEPPVSTPNEASTQDDSQEKKVYPSHYKNGISHYPAEVTTDTSNPPDAKKYHALPQLFVPRYILPGLMIYENAVLVSATIGRTDPLYRHSWTAFANYRSDAQFVGGGGTYMFTRYKPIFYLGAIRYAVDWGTVNNTRFYEERNQIYTGTTFTLFNYHRLNLAYFYEHRSALTNLNVNLINMKPYAGVRWQYTFGRSAKYANSISQENGYLLKLGGEWTDQMLGSDDVNEEITVRGDFRGYIELPWSDHHVLALRAAAGWVWGDQQQFGVYRLGGPFGEGPGANYSSKVFPLRGLSGITYGGDQVFIFSSEYRIPLATNINWGIGTLPVFLDKIHMSLFVDGGDIRYRTDADNLFSRLLVSTGIEFSGDFVLGYGLPLTVRTGYGIVLTNRWRMNGLTDSVTMQPLRYGSVYLQLGTMF